MKVSKHFPNELNKLTVSKQFLDKVSKLKVEKYVKILPSILRIYLTKNSPFNLTNFLTNNQNLILWILESRKIRESSPFIFTNFMTKQSQI